MLLHADAIAQNRASRVRAGGIHRNDAHRAVLLAIVARQLIDQRALARARRTSEAEYACMSTVRKKNLKQFRPAR